MWTPEALCTGRTYCSEWDGWVWNQFRFLPINWKAEATHISKKPHPLTAFMVPFFPLVPDCAEFFALISLFCVYVIDLPGVLAACADILESSSLPLPSVAASAAIIRVRARFCVVGVAAVERRWRRRSKSDGAYETTKTKGTSLFAIAIKRILW